MSAPARHQMVPVPSTDTTAARTEYLLGRIMRCALMIDAHRRGIELNEQRIREAQDELAVIEDAK